MRNKAEAMKDLGKTYRDWIVIQGKSAVDDGEGGFNQEWVDLFGLWSNVTTIQARQQFQFQSVGVEATHRIEFREPVAVPEVCRIKFGTKFFEIKAGDDDHGKRQDAREVYFITCKEMR